MKEEHKYNDSVKERQNNSKNEKTWTQQQCEKGHKNNINKEHRHSGSVMEGLGYEGQHEKKNT